MKTAFTGIISVLLIATSYGAIVDLSGMLPDPTFDNITYTGAMTYKQLTYNGWKASKTGANYTYGPAYYIQGNTATLTVGASWYQYTVSAGSADSGNSYLGLYAPWGNGLFETETPITLTAGNTYALSFKVRKELNLVMFDYLVMGITKADGVYGSPFGQKQYFLGTDYTNATGAWQTLVYTYTPSENITGYFFAYGHPNSTAHAGMAFDTFAAIPEPTSIALACMAGFFCLIKRKRRG